MKTIQLIGYGKAEAQPAKNIKVGDTLVWNYGQTEKVDSMQKETKTQIVINVLSESGKIYTRRMSKERLVCIR